MERRYRDNLNTKLEALHCALRATQFGTTAAGHDKAAVKDEPSEAPAKFRKSDVLVDALNYVDQTELEMRHMANEIHSLRERVAALEKLVKCEDCSLLKQFMSMRLQRPRQ